jgi:hypothetical protein
MSVNTVLLVLQIQTPNTYTLSRNFAKVCGFCSSKEHITKGCPKEKSAGEHKCALCDMSHSAWSQKCELRKKQLEKVAEAKKDVGMNPYF